MSVVKKMRLNNESEVSTDVMNVDDGQREPDVDAIKMFVGQIPRSKTEEDLIEMFKEYGEIYSLNVLRDRHTGNSKGCCFITYYSRSSALAAQNALHNIKTMPGMQHAIQMKPADTDKKGFPGYSDDRKLFVGMISKTTSEDDLRLMFSSFGIIEDCVVLKDSQGNHKGCAFITFSTRSSAQQAINNLHNSTTLEGCNQPIVVKFSFTQREKEAKRAQMAHSSSANGLVPPMNNSYLPSANIPKVGGMVGGGNVGNSVGALAGTTGLNPLAIQSLIAAAATNTSPVINQLLQAAGPAVASNNSPAVNNAQQIQNLQTLSALFSAAAANQAAVSNFGVQNLNALSNQSLANVSNVNGQGPSNSGLLSGSQTPNQVPGNPQSSISNMGFPANLNSSALANQNAGGDAFTQAYAGMQQLSSAFPNTQNLYQQSSTAVGKNIEGPDGCNLFIYHLPPEFSDHDLFQTFSAFGTVISSKVFIDKVTSLSKCFGFVSYNTADSASKAIQAMNGFQVGMKRLKVQLKRNKNDSKPY